MYKYEEIMYLEILFYSLTLKILLFSKLIVFYRRKYISFGLNGANTMA